MIVFAQSAALIEINKKNDLKWSQLWEKIKKTLYENILK